MAEGRPAQDSRPVTSRRGGTTAAPGAEPGGRSLTAVRSRIASALWLVAALLAAVLAIGALCAALELNEENAIVAFFLDTAALVDFGEFKEFRGQDAAVKSALVNWGIAAVIWLVVGKVLDRVVRP